MITVWFFLRNIHVLFFLYPDYIKVVKSSPLQAVNASVSKGFHNQTVLTNADINCKLKHHWIASAIPLKPYSICYSPDQIGQPKYIPDDQFISYIANELPYSDPHQKQWASYGEFKYVPPGVFVHNLKHGAAVFLYHPCTPSYLVKMFKTVARNCTWKHVISSYSDVLNETYPLGILTFGCEYRMSSINVTDIKAFMKHRPFSPESTSSPGTYNHSLIHPSFPLPGQPSEGGHFCEKLQQSWFADLRVFRSIKLLPSTIPSPSKTPRTEEAVWAVGSLVFLLTMLGMAVCYTRLWRKGNNGESFEQTRVWTDENEPGSASVAAIVRKFPHAFKSKMKKLRTSRMSRDTRYHRITEEEEGSFTDDDRL